MSDSTLLDVERAETLLRPLMPAKFSVNYEPAMPGTEGRSYRWFQVVFAIGPGENASLRTQVHELFPRMLAALAPLAPVYEADHVTLRARRFLYDQKSDDRPFMFIQADWTGAAVRRMQEGDDFSTWANECLFYRNESDKHDPFNKTAVA